MEFGCIIRLKIMISPDELIELEPVEIKKLIEEKIEAENIKSLDLNNAGPMMKKIIRRVIIGGKRMPRIYKGLYIWYHGLDTSIDPEAIVIDCVYLKTRLWIVVRGKKVEAVDFAYLDESGRYKWDNYRF